MCREKHKRWFFLKFLFAIVFVGVISLLLMLLWNGLLPEIFGFKSIDYLQAAGLLILSKILFSGVFRRPGFMWHHRDRMEYWHKKYETKCGTGTEDKPKE
jgi:hypothetical protein